MVLEGVLRRALILMALLTVQCGDDDEVAEPQPAIETSEPVERADPVEAEVAPPDGPLIGLDTHVDTTQRMLDDGDDPFDTLEGGHLDVARMREGGLTGAFFSIYVSPRRFDESEAWERALALTRRVREVVAAHPDEARLCRSADDVRDAAREGKIAVLMGVEGAHALGTDDPETVLARVEQLYELGNRYLTLTWSIDSPLGHSSSGAHPERGLTPLGRRVVSRMNELGMIVDISHVSDRTFWDVMEHTRLPVIASHSSARALADHPRNMTDAMIRRVGQNGGAVCVNYYTQYIDADYRGRRRAIEFRRKREFEPLEEQYESWVDRGAAAFALAQRLDPDLRPPGMETLVAHFAHIVEIAGPTAACLGSDFDGVPELPLGMTDAGDLGVLREALAERGLPVRAIWGENVLRVLDAHSHRSSHVSAP